MHRLFVTLTFIALLSVCITQPSSADAYDSFLKNEAEDADSVFHMDAEDSVLDLVGVKPSVSPHLKVIGVSSGSARAEADDASRDQSRDTDAGRARDSRILHHVTSSEHTPTDHHRRGTRLNVRSVQDADPLVQAADPILQGLDPLHPDMSVRAITGINPAVMTTVVAVFLMFVYMMLTASMKRWTKDEQAMIRPLLPTYGTKGNQPYLITMATSSRPGAGLYSGQVKVTVQGRGASTETLVIPADDVNNSKPFRRGCDKSFIYYSPVNLDELKLIDLELEADWNPVKWYLCYMTVIELTSRRQWYFPCNNWFEASRGETHHKTLMAGTGRKANLLMENIWRGIQEYHLWVAPWCSREVYQRTTQWMYMSLLFFTMCVLMFSHTVMYSAPLVAKMAVHHLSPSVTAIFFIIADGMTFMIIGIIQLLVKYVRSLNQEECILYNMHVFHNSDSKTRRKTGQKFNASCLGHNPGDSGGDVDDSLPSYDRSGEYDQNFSNDHDEMFTPPSTSTPKAVTTVGNKSFAGYGTMENTGYKMADLSYNDTSWMGNDSLDGTYISMDGNVVYANQTVTGDPRQRAGEWQDRIKYNVDSSIAKRVSPVSPKRDVATGQVPQTDQSFSGYENDSFSHNKPERVEVCTYALHEDISKLIQNQIQDEAKILSNSQVSDDEFCSSIGEQWMRSIQRQLQLKQIKLTLAPVKLTVCVSKGHLDLIADQNFQQLVQAISVASRDAGLDVDATMNELVVQGLIPSDWKDSPPLREAPVFDNGKSCGSSSYEEYVKKITELSGPATPDGKIINKNNSNIENDDVYTKSTNTGATSTSDSSSAIKPKTVRFSWTDQTRSPDEAETLSSGTNASDVSELTEKQWLQYIGIKPATEARSSAPPKNEYHLTDKSRLDKVKSHEETTLSLKASAPSMDLSNLIHEDDHGERDARISRIRSRASLQRMSELHILPAEYRKSEKPRCTKQKRPEKLSFVAPDSNSFKVSNRTSDISLSAKSSGSSVVSSISSCSSRKSSCSTRSEGSEQMHVSWQKCWNQIKPDPDPRTHVSCTDQTSESIAQYANTVMSDAERRKNIDKRFVEFSEYLLNNLNESAQQALLGSDEAVLTGQLRQSVEDISQFVRQISQERVSAVINRTSSNSSSTVSSCSKRHSDSSLPGHASTSDYDLEPRAQSDTNISIQRTSGLSNTSIDLIQQEMSLGEFAKQLSFNITSGALSNALSSLDKLAKRKLDDSFKHSHMTTKAVLSNDLLICDDNPKVSIKISQDSVNSSTSSIDITRRPSSQIMQSIDKDIAGRISSENVVKTTCASIQNVYSDEVLARVEEAVTSYSDEQISDFASTIVSSLYTKMSQKLEEAMEAMLREHKSVNIASLMERADQELREHVIPPILDHIIFLIEEEASSVEDFDVDLMMMVYAGQYIETIVTNAVMQTHVNINRELLNTKKLSTDRKQTGSPNLPVQVAKYPEGWWRKHLPKNYNNNNSDGKLSSASSSSTNVSTSPTQSMILRHILEEVQVNLRTLSSSRACAKCDQENPCTYCKAARIDIVRSVTEAIQGTAASKYLICRTLSMAEENLKKCADVMDEKKERYNTEHLVALGRALLDGSTAEEHYVILEKVTADLRDTALQQAVQTVAQEFVQDKVNLADDKELKALVHHLQTASKQTTEQLVMKRTINVGRPNINVGQQLNRNSNAQDDSCWWEDGECEDDLIAEFQEIRSMLVSRLEESINQQRILHDNSLQQTFHLGHMGNVSNTRPDSWPGDRSQYEYQTHVAQLNHPGHMTVETGSIDQNKSPDLVQSQRSFSKTGRINPFRSKVSFQPGASSMSIYGSDQQNPLRPQSLFTETPRKDEFLIDLSDDAAETDKLLDGAEYQSLLDSVDMSKLSDDPRMRQNRLGAFVYDYLRSKLIVFWFAPVLAVLLSAMALSCLAVSAVLGNQLDFDHSRLWVMFYILAIITHTVIVEPIKALIVAIHWTFFKQKVMF